MSTKLITSHEQTNTLRTSLCYWRATPLLTRYIQKPYNLKTIYNAEAIPYKTDDPLLFLSHTPITHQPQLEEVATSTQCPQSPYGGWYKKWVYYLQGSAVASIQLVCSWSHSLQHLEWSHILVLELFWKLQPEVPGAQQNFLACKILNVPEFLILLALISLLSVKQAFVYQILD